MLPDHRLVRYCAILRHLAAQPVLAGLIQQSRDFASGPSRLKTWS